MSAARVRFALALAAVVAAAAAHPARAAGPTPAPAGPGAGLGSTTSNFAGFDTIRTAQIHYNINNGTFEFPTHFSATRQGMDITADRANGNSQKKQLHAVGNVVVHQVEPTGTGKTSALTQRPSTLTTDMLDVDGGRQIYTATGNMHFTQEGGKEASADRAVLDDLTHHLHMEGHVRVRDGERTIEATQLDYDTLTGEVDGNGNVTITAPAPTDTPGPPQPASTKKPKKKAS